MPKAVLSRCTLGLALVTLISFAVAQEPVQTTAPSADVAHYRAKEILGAKIALDGGAAGGTVDDIVFDANGNVDYLLVARDDSKMVTVPWDAADFNVEKRVATVRITPERYEAIPTWTVKQYPTFSTPTYRTQIYKYYGLTPGEQRRLIRRGAVVPVR